MGLKRRILGFFTFLFIAIFSAHAMAASYSCDKKQYDSCNSGYFMTVNGVYNGTPAVGNACTTCPANATCAGGNAAPVCKTGYNHNGNSTSTGGACVANTYTIKYDANGGSGTMSNTTCTYGSDCTLRTNSFTKTGYTFAGWTYNGTSYSNG